MTWWQRVLLGLLLLAHWALTWRLAATMGPFQADSEFHFGATMGVFFGQGILASLWLVCLRDSRWWRCLCVLLLAAWGWLAIILGIKSSGPLPLLAEFSVALQVLLSLLTFSGVLSVASRIGRWEIRSPGDDRSASKQFSLRRSLAMMAMACVFLAVARQVMLPWNNNLRDDIEILTAQITVLSVAFAIACVVLAVNCCVMLPVIAVMFRLQEHRWLSYMAILFLGVPIHGVVAFTVESVFLLPWLFGDDSAIAWMLLVLNTVQSFTIVLSLALLQAIGFRLERNRKDDASSGSVPSETEGSAALPFVSVHDPHRIH